MSGFLEGVFVGAVLGVALQWAWMRMRLMPVEKALHRMLSLMETEKSHFSRRIIGRVRANKEGADEIDWIPLLNLLATIQWFTGFPAWMPNRVAKLDPRFVTRKLGLGILERKVALAALLVIFAIISTSALVQKYQRLFAFPDVGWGEYTGVRDDTAYYDIGYGEIGYYPEHVISLDGKSPVIGESGMIVDWSASNPNGPASCFIREGSTAFGPFETSYWDQKELWKALSLFLCH